MCSLFWVFTKYFGMHPFLTSCNILALDKCPNLVYQWWYSISAGKLIPGLILLAVLLPGPERNPLCCCLETDLLSASPYDGLNDASHLHHLTQCGANHFPQGLLFGYVMFLHVKYGMHGSRVASSFPSLLTSMPSNSALYYLHCESHPHLCFLV